MTINDHDDVDEFLGFSCILLLQGGLKGVRNQSQ